MKTFLLKTAAALKWLLRWAAMTLLPAFVVFVVGEQVESFRLGAIAACESAKDSANCMRQKGYLASSPYYPDITRRLVGGYARSVGGALGASYAAVPAEDN
jgi:hypothetical protein